VIASCLRVLISCFKPPNITPLMITYMNIAAQSVPIKKSFIMVGIIRVLMGLSRDYFKIAEVGFGGFISNTAVRF